MEKFFNKILLTYTLILVITLTILAIVILQNFIASSSNEAVNYNVKVVQDVKYFLDQKMERVKLILQQLYLNKDPYNSLVDFSDVFALLDSKNMDQSSFDYVTKVKNANKYMQYGCMLDDDILDILLLNTNDLSYFPYTTRSSFSYQTVNPDVKGLFGFVSKNPNGTKAIPTVNIYESGSNIISKKDIFSIATYIKSLDFSRNTGVLLVNFNSNSILTAYDSNNAKFNSNVILFTRDGNVVFDSAGQYYNAPYPYFNEIKSASSDKTTKLTIHEKIISISTSREDGYIIAGIIPEEQILQSTFNFRGLVIVILVLCIIAAVLLSFMAVTLFSKRIKAINTTMDMVKAGNLSARVKLGKSMDEISRIAVNFNQMCDHLNDTINKVYLSELKQKDASLKQKSAELYALQSQVNPHFLYNTLEAIRMRALTHGNHEVAEMILVLATLFRNSIKKDMIVKIKDELKYCKSYLELYTLRYGMNLEVTFDVDESILEFSIVKLLLQPLIENAVVHGIDTNKQGNLINIKAVMTDKDIVISIQDNGIGIEAEELETIKRRMEAAAGNESDSVGIVNVNQRIRLIYGEQYGLTIRSKKYEGTAILVKIPSRSIKEMENSVQNFDR